MTPPQHAGRWTWPQRITITLLCLGSAAVAGPAGYSIYQTSRDLAAPYLHAAAWILPVACEAAWLALFGWGVMLTWRKAADVPARLLGSFLIAALSVAIQVYAGRHSAADVMVRLTIVACLFVVSVTVKTALMRLRGGKVRGEGMAAGEWIAHPVHSLRLWRWRKTWGGMDLGDARALYLILLYVIAVAQAHPAVGSRWRWRSRLPVTLRYELTMGLLPDAIARGEGDWQEAVRDHVAVHLDPLASAIADAMPPAIEAATPPASPDASAAPDDPPAPRQPARRPAASDRAKARAKAVRLMTDNPAMPLADVAAKCGISERTISRIRSEMPRRLHVAAEG